MNPERRRVLDAVAAHLPAMGVIGIDGVDGAGKTTFADELAEVVRASGRDIVRVRADDFLNPPEVRHRRGRWSPSGYWADSVDYGRLRAALPPTGLTIVDGVFLQRPELAGRFALVVFLDTSFEEAVRRMASRDGSPDDVDHPQLRRYVVAQRRYLDNLQPRERCDVLIDNNEVDTPMLVRPGWAT